jgi:predicted lipoprotein with Yx(FWY)xxD motif
MSTTRATIRRLAGHGVRPRDMRNTVWTVLLILAYLPGPAAQSRAPGSEHPPVNPAANAPYPNEVTLIQNRANEWTYLNGKDQHPLYVSDKDGPDRSTCYDLCDTKWVPLLARPDSKPVGEWTLAPRKGGERQWAYRHRPVYMLVHDSDDVPLGDGKEGHHLLPTFK